RTGSSRSGSTAGRPSRTVKALRTSESAAPGHAYLTGSPRLRREGLMTRFKLAATAAAVVVISIAATASATVPNMLSLGPTVKSKTATYLGYYDGHKDTYLVTDVSSKAQATAMHINYSAELAKVKGAPPQYFISGKAAPGQIAVFGSEPGESDYN